MGFLEFNEQIDHRTGSFPLAFYAVDANHPRYHMRMHWHRESEIISVTQGTLSMFIGGEPFTLRAGEALVLGEGMLHGGEPEEAAYRCLVFSPGELLIGPEPIRSLVGAVSARTFCLDRTLLETDRGLSGSVDRLMRYASQGALVKTTGCLYELYGYLSELDTLGVRPAGSRSSATTEQLKPALEYIERNYAQRITLEELSRLTGLSEKYFCRAFRTIVHASPIEYVNHYRIECAAHLLTETDRSVADIAQTCGFNDSSFFIKQFRRQKGTTPHRYRRENAVYDK